MNLASCAVIACLIVGPFSSAAPGTEWPDTWRPLTFTNIARHTQYALVVEGGTVVVRAESDAAASGLIRPIRIDPKDYPILTWRWRVENVLTHGDVTKKAGDDYPARLYITFAFDPTRASIWDRAKYKAAQLLYGSDVPFRALNYIWESKTPKGTIVPNPYTDWTRMIVVESGPDALQRWVEERRNLPDDFRRAFHEEPPAITGVAIMTDTDNTKERAVAYYGDIVFSAQ